MISKLKRAWRHRIFARVRRATWWLYFWAYAVFAAVAGDAVTRIIAGLCVVAVAVGFVLSKLLKRWSNELKAEAARREEHRAEEEEEHKFRIELINLEHEDDLRAFQAQYKEISLMHPKLREVVDSILKANDMERMLIPIPERTREPSKDEL